jgi:hypothetical protein
VSILRRLGGLWARKWGTGFSLVPLIVFSVLAAALVTQSSATLAYPMFQSPVSPVQVPTATLPPPQAPTEQPEGPAEESPVAPPVESPVPPPPEEPGESPVPTAEPEATSGGQTPEAEATTTPVGEEQSPPTVGGMSLAVLIDALVVALSSLWLCCGGVVLVIFVLLVVASFVLRVT